MDGFEDLLEVCKMFFESPGIYKNVIDEAPKKFAAVLVEDDIHEALESGGCISKSKGHPGELV